MTARNQPVLAALAAIALGAIAVPACAVTQSGTSVGIDEHLGRIVPLDIPFRDEAGKDVTLRQLVDRPTVLSLVYYSCPGICTPLLTGLAETIGKMEPTAGKEFRVITISFDTRDTPRLAVEKKHNYMNLVNRDLPPRGWEFLTGTQDSIDRITDAVGFRYRKEGDQYVHTGAIYVLSPKGKIVRYLYGTTFLPFDVEMALREASQGRVGPTINRILLYCFSYDPHGRKYVLQTTRIAGAAVLLTALAFVVYLGASSRKRRSAPGERDENVS